MAQEIDEAKVRKAVQAEIPLIISTFTLPHEMELYFEQAIEVFLRQLEQERLKNYLVYCVQELAGNAKKANTKRVYFMERGLSLSNPDDYKLGMAKFKKETLDNSAHYLQLQKDKGFYIKLVLQNRKDIFSIEVRNNSGLTALEQSRIQEKLLRSRQFDSLEDALSQVLDDSEGAGLGLVILVLMLKRMGLDEDCFNISGDSKETVARLSIPLDKTRAQNFSFLSAAIVGNVNSLPQFPENIIKIQKLIEDPHSDMAAIARHVSLDPAMTADLLKTVNSAAYMLKDKVDNIADAAKMVGMRGLKNLLYSYGTQKILGDETVEKRQLWFHSYKTAFYAYNLVKNFRRDRNLLDDVYVAGILHDMGKIVFSNVHPALLRKIRKLCVQKELPATTFEDLSAGMNHPEIGALIAEKWHFPGNLVSAIRYHHDPLATPQEHRDLTEAVYLANLFCDYETGALSFDQFDGTVLGDYNLNSPERLDSLVKRFAEGFKQHQQMGTA
ncbi:MAG: ATP-binding protein [Treponema sp.]|nr:ATP-binding protein [Treponema sp.]